LPDPSAGNVRFHANAAKSNEFFYLDKDGKKQDAALHEEILAGIDRGDAARLKNASKQRARKAGISDAMIRKLYADD
jgi:hypothetical protein